MIDYGVDPDILTKKKEWTRAELEKELDLEAMRRGEAARRGIPYTPKPKEYPADEGEIRHYTF
jgi:hypothetical protein